MDPSRFRGGHGDVQRAGAPLLQTQAENCSCSAQRRHQRLKQMRERLFRGADIDRTRGSGFKLKEEVFRLGIRKKML